MSYNFTFDLSKLPQALFRELAEFAEKEGVHKKLGGISRVLVKKFNVDTITGLNITDSILVIEDLIDITIKNNVYRDSFQKIKKKALFLPHCCRKYMDSRCKAEFNPETSSYFCNHCSTDCQVHKATLLAKQENMDIYVLPGASGIKKIFLRRPYEGIVRIACTEELKLGGDILQQYDIPMQAIPLIKNGCSETQFNFDTLKKIMRKSN